MDKRLQKIIDETRVEFGLENYYLESTAIYKRYGSKGEPDYQFSMEWFPFELDEPIEEDSNPTGTACIDYSIGRQQYDSVVFVMGQSFSTKAIFREKTPEEVGQWIEDLTGLVVGKELNLSKAFENGFFFKSDIDGIRMSPDSVIEVKFDDAGKLTFFSTFGTAASGEEVVKSEFTLTLEEIEPIVRQQLQLVKIPSEKKKCFVPVYAMEEVYITVDGARIIPFLVDERTMVNVDEVLEWDEPLEFELHREPLRLSSEVSVEEAFGNADESVNLTLSDVDINRSKEVVRDVLRTIFPQESGQWKLETIRRYEKYIEARCWLVGEDPTYFNRKVMVVIEPETYRPLNYMDNADMLGLFDEFAHAGKAVVTHEEAFEKMVSYITLDPAYVYDPQVGKYVLCGLLDAAECVDAVTGEVLSLGDI